MKLPNGDVAIIEIAKIREYCLSLTHPIGKHKARVFSSALGMTAAHVEELLAALAKAAREGNLDIGVADTHGARFIIDFELTFGGRSAMIRSCWIIRTGENVPRFVTCFIL